MKRVFISQPMRDRSKEDILRERNIAIRKLVEMFGSVKVLDTVFELGMTPVEALGESIKYLSKADIAVFLPGWDEARGCRVEYRVCLEYGIPMFQLKF